MTKFPVSDYPPVQGLTLCIADQDQVLRLEYDAAMTRHRSASWWGTAVGFRAMQRAALALSDDYLWSRDGLRLISGHPGPGVLDALNYVTACIDRGRCTVMQNPDCEYRCHAGMKFEWWVSDHQKTAHIRLREDFVPAVFFSLLERIAGGAASEEDQWALESWKVNLSARIWSESLEQSFSVSYLDPLTSVPLPLASA